MKTLCRIFALGFAASLTLLAGDLTITFNTKAKALGFSKSSVETHYYSAKFHRVRSEDGKQDTLVDFEKGISYQIDHGKKSIQFMKIDDMLEAMEAMKAPGGNAPGVGEVMGALFGKAEDIRVDDTGAEVVAGRTCAKYRLSAGRLSMDLSADPKLKPPVSPAAWAKAIRLKALAGSMMANPTMKKLYEEMSKIEGIPLKTQMKGFMGADSSSEATKVAEGALPPGTFDLPTGYKMEDLGKKLKEEMAKQR